MRRVLADTAEMMAMTKEKIDEQIPQPRGKTPAGCDFDPISKGNEAADDVENAKHSCSLEVVGIFHVLCVGGWMM